jgi:hypothetical protein
MIAEAASNVPMVALRQVRTAPGMGAASMWKNCRHSRNVVPLFPLEAGFSSESRWWSATGLKAG